MLISIKRSLPKKRASKKSPKRHSSSDLPTIFRFRTVYIVAVLLLALVVLKKDSLNEQFSISNVKGQSTLLAKGSEDSGKNESEDRSDEDVKGDENDDSEDMNDDRDEDLNDDRDEDIKPSGSGSSGSSRRVNASPKTTVKSHLETEEIKFETEQNDEKTETQIELSESERIRARTQDGRSRIDITSGGMKTRLEYRDDRVIVKVEQEDGEEVELEDDDDTILKIEERLADDGIRISTGSGERVILQRGNAGAVANFPLSVDLATNTLFMTTPSGQQKVRVLPDRAIQNLIAANVVSRIGNQELARQIRSEDLSSVSQLITLAQQNNVPVYEINGVSDQKLLGFIPVELQKEVVVSAETGEVVDTNQNFFTTLLDLISI